MAHEGRLSSNELSAPSDRKWPIVARRGLLTLIDPEPPVVTVGFAATQNPWPLEAPLTASGRLRR